MEGSNNPAQGSNYNPATTDVNDANNTPFTVPYNQASANSTEYNPAGSFSYAASPINLQTPYTSPGVNANQTVRPTDSNRRKMLTILGGAVASLALAIGLGSAVYSRVHNNGNQVPPPRTIPQAVPQLILI